MLLRAEGISRW